MGKSSNILRNIEVLYRDDYIMAFNKPKNLLVIPNENEKSNTLVNLVNLLFSSLPNNPKLNPCHRLDRETTGAILFAFGKKNQQLFMEMFASRSINKKYIAVVNGVLKQDSGIINAKIEGKEAITEYRVIKNGDNYTILDIELFTGRTNQIRIHFAGIGHPLVGESKFVFRRDFKLKANRVLLHSKELSFIHPITNENIVITAPIPDDIKSYF